MPRSSFSLFGRAPLSAALADALEIVTTPELADTLTEQQRELAWISLRHAHRPGDTPAPPYRPNQRRIAGGEAA